jgi:Golgi phosphoprotein 3
MHTLAEDLLLLALDDDKGTVSWSRSTALPYGLGGALLMDLALNGRVNSREKKIVLVDSSPTGDEVLDAALETIRTSTQPRDAKHWVKRLGDRRGLRDHLARRLVARGILREQDRAFLWVFRDHRFPTDDPSPEAALRGRIRDATLGATEPDTRTLLLLSLVNACNLAGSLFSREERTQATRRIKDLVEGERFGQAVGGAVADAAAATAAVSAAAFTTVVAPGASH